jgi:hypothetical protein
MLYPVLSRQASERGAAEGGHLLIELAGRRRAAEDRLGQLGPQGGQPLRLDGGALGWRQGQHRFQGGKRRVQRAGPRAR